MKKETALKRVETQIAKLQQKVLRRKSEKPYKYLYTPYPKQEIFHRSKEKIVIFRGGNGAGKTAAGVLEALMTGYRFNPYRDIKRNRKVGLIWVAGDTMTTVEEIIMSKMYEWLPPERLGLWKFQTRPRPVLTLFNANGHTICRILLKSYEQGRKAFQGDEPDLIILDEEPPQDIWTEILARTRAGGLIRITATPFGYGLIADLLEQAVDDDQIKDIQVPLMDNIYLEKEEKERLIKQFGREINRIDGSIYVAEGLIYQTNWKSIEIDVFDRKMYEDPEEDVVWQFWELIDLGGTDEFAALFIWFNPHNNVAVVVDEYYASGGDITVHKNAIKAIENSHEAAVIKRVYDNNNKVAFHEFAKAGLPGNEVKKGKGSVEAGILLTRQRLAAGELKVVKGVAPNLEKEYNTYRYSKNGDGKPARGQKDHAVTALRYFCFTARKKFKKKKQRYERSARAGTSRILGGLHRRPQKKSF